MPRFFCALLPLHFLTGFPQTYTDDWSSCVNYHKEQGQMILKMKLHFLTELWTLVLLDFIYVQILCAFFHINFLTVTLNFTEMISHLASIIIRDAYFPDAIFDRVMGPCFQLVLDLKPGFYAVYCLVYCLTTSNTGQLFCIFCEMAIYRSEGCRLYTS